VVGVSTEPLNEYATEVIDAERAVLGAALETDGACIDELDLTGADFSNPRLGDLYDAMVRARLNGAHVSYATLADAYPDQAVFISSLVEHGRFKYAVEEHAAIVGKQALRRRLSAVAAGLVQRANEPGLSADQLIDQAQALVADAVGGARHPVRFLRDILPGLADKLHDVGGQAIPTPWASLTGALGGGFRPGAVYVIGGRPAQGKSVIAQQCAVALAQHGLVAFSSLEMSEEELTARFVAERIPMNVGRIKDGTMTPADWETFALRKRRVTDLGIAIDDRTNVSVADIRQHARNVSRRGPLAGVVVDYLQLTASDNPRAERRLQIDETSRQLKVLAKDLRVPVIVLSQLNRQSENRTDPRPKLHELKESGAIEQDADVVILLFRDKTGRGSNIHLDGAKNRHGEAFDLDLHWEGALSRATEWPEEAQP
jgi:replicative DNA helicase